MTRVLTVLLVLALVAAAAIALLRQPEPQVAIAPPAAQPAVEPMAPSAAPPLPAVDAPPAETDPGPPPSTQRTPRFDVVRVEPDGSTMLAGVAEPGSTVSVIVDGTVVGTVETDRTGAFAGFVQLPQGEGVRRLDLSAQRGDGPAQRSTEPVLVAGSDDAPEPEPPTVAIARAGGVDLLQDPARDSAGQVTVDLVSYGEGETLAVSGRGNVLRLVRLYANATFVAETMVREDGTWEIAATTALPPGSHTLRVDEIDAGGTVTSRIEAPFVREDPDAVALQPGEMRVEPGQSLWQIAQSVYGSGLRFTVIYEANTDRIRDPNLIFPGQILTIPAASTRP